MAFELPKLPYAQEALEPHISAKTLSFHYGKHHAAYVAKLNELVAGKPGEKQKLEEIILSSAKEKGPLFNNAAQVWNHTFFWNCLAPNGGGAPSGVLADKIKAGFGSLDKLKEELKAAAVGQFGSGWAWLVLDRGQLKVTKTPNAENPMILDQTALFTIDVWEHAYYLDFQNRRPDFVQTVLDKLVNWEFVGRNLR
ncbi:MAG: superoxide dismutase [Deltaproteobacteria bacterium]|nr:superoxide dismutase [Deltaproteobacteria bacterium]